MNGLLRNIKDPNAKFAWIAKKWSFKWWEPKVQQDVFRWQNPSFSNNFAPKFKMTKKQEICFGCDFNKNLEIYWHKWLFDTFVVLSFLWSVITLSHFHKVCKFFSFFQCCQKVFMEFRAKCSRISEFSATFQPNFGRFRALFATIFLIFALPFCFYCIFMWQFFKLAKK